jgi:glucose/arabinose dehydrogenase
LAVWWVVVGCGSASGGTNIGEPMLDSGLAVEVVAQGFSSPVFAAAPAGDPRLFVVEQTGRVWIVRDGQRSGTPFLDISSKLRAGGERGLLGLAFHPDYATNGLFYVDYTDRSGDTQIERYTVSGDPDLADPGSAKLILSIEQPYGNHNGGMVMFGPDGMLYIGMGDGGSANDPQDNGQNRGTLLGALLRLDIDGGDPYAIPPDNLFAAEASARGEIWAYGLRNPWRFAFDPVGDALYIADVGQNAWEEINIAPAGEAGLNYGWNIKEGAHCFRSLMCDDAGLVEPAVEYGHGDGCSVIGGYVYRGAQIPDVVGHYFYSDWCGGWLRSFRYANGEISEHTEWQVGDIGNVLSFGEGANGELYVTSQNGMVYRVVSGE